MATLSSLSIIQSAKLLKGNAKTMMPVEPLYSISWAMLQFYLGLYMSEQGVTSQQMGYLISIQALSSIFFSFFGGYLTNRFGRKRTLLVSDLIGFPGAVLIWAFADRFELFALAYFIHGLNVVVNVAWTCFLVEDIDTKTRIAAYNFINGLGLCSGIFVPISGYIVGRMGLVAGERRILFVCYFVMVTRILIRNYFGKETEIGKKIKEEYKNNPELRKKVFSTNNFKMLGVIRKDRRLLFALCTSVLMQLNASVAAMSTTSIYYVMFLKEKLGIEQSLVSYVGTVSSVFMLISFLFVTPASINKPIRRVLIRNLLLVTGAVLGLITLGRFSPYIVFLFIAVYALGYQGVSPMVNTLVTDTSKGYDMPAILSSLAMITSALTALCGPIAGRLYTVNPYLLYIVSIVIMLLMMATTIIVTAKATEKGD